MKLLSIQEVYNNKLKRQHSIEELEYHASGHCVHIGKLSPGCQKCFVPYNFAYNPTIGAKCNADCVYCYGVNKEHEPTKEDFRKIKMEMCVRALKEDFRCFIPCLSFTGGGDPLIYLDAIADFMKSFRNSIVKDMNRKPWCYLYTNGLNADIDTILKLRDSGFHEIRFHLGASNFSNKVRQLKNPTPYNSFVKSIQQAPGKRTYHEDVEGLCAEYDL